MATLTGTALLDAMLAEQGVTISDIQYNIIAARFQQMIDAGITSNLAFATRLSANPQFAESVPEGENTALYLSTVVGEQKTIIEEGEGGETGPITFELTADSEAYENDTATFTVTASRAVDADTTVTLQVSVGNPDASDQLTTTTNFNDFSQGVLNLMTKTIAAGETSVSFGVSALLDNITELSETYSVEIKVGSDTFTQTVTVLDGSSTGGQTFTLTNSVDTIPGLVGTSGTTDNSGNDTIKGVFGLATASENTLNTADDIDGGTGTDTLSLTAADTTASPAAISVKNVEVISIKDVVGSTFNAQLIENDPIIGFNSTTTGLTSTVNNASAASIFSFAGKGDLTVGLLDASGSDDEVMLSLSSVGTSKTARSTLDVSNSNDVEAVTIYATGTNYIELLAGASAADLTLTGDGVNNINLSTTDAIAAVMNVDASQSTGDNTFVLGGILNTTDTLAGGTASDTVEANLTLATLVKPTLSGIETLKLDFDAAATLDLSDTADLTTISLSGSSAHQTITKASSEVTTVSVTSQADTDNNLSFSYDAADKGELTLNVGSTSSDITLAAVTLTNTTSVNLNTVGTKVNDFSSSFDINGDQDALNINVVADSSLYIDGIDIEPGKDLGALNITVEEGGYYSGGVYLSGGGSLGDVEINVGADAEYYGYNLVSGSGYDSLSIGNITINAIGDNAYFSGFFNLAASGGDNSIGNISLTADGDGADIYYHTSASGAVEVGDISLTADNGGYINITVSGDSQWSGYYDETGATNFGDISINVGQDSAVNFSGYVDGGRFGNLDINITGDSASAGVELYADFMSGDIDNDSDTDLIAEGSIGDINVSINGDDSNAYVFAEASGGDVGNITFSIEGQNASGNIEIEAWESYASGGEGILGNIGTTTVTAGDDTAFDIDLAASNNIGDVSITGGTGVSAGVYYNPGGGGALGGAIGMTSITLGDDANADVYVSGFNGDSVGEITIEVGDNSDVYVEGTSVSGAAFDDISITIGDDSDAQIYFSGASGSVGNVSFTAGSNSDVTFGFSGAANNGVGEITATGGDSLSNAYIYLRDDDFDSFGGVDLSLWNGYAEIDVSAVTVGTSIKVGADGSDVTGTQGSDNIFLGAGEDTVYFESGTEVDEIFSFTVADDTIDLYYAGTTVDVADNAAAAGAPTNTNVYVFVDGSNTSTAETIDDFTDLADVASFLDAYFNTAAGTEAFGAVINDGGSSAYVYDVALTDVGIEADEITLIGIVNADDALTATNVVA